MKKQILFFILFFAGLTAMAQTPVTTRRVNTDSIVERVLNNGIQEIGERIFHDTLYHTDSIFRLGGSLIPIDDTIFNLGADALRWNKLYADTVDANVIDGQAYPAVTPQQYGAVADSVTDDYQAFQDAVDAQTEDVFIYVPKGYYRITDNIVISGKRRVKIWGEGVLLMEHDTGGVIFIDRGDTGDIEISGLKFDFQSRRVNNIAVNIYYRAPEKMIIQNCEFLNFGDTATIGIRLERVPTAVRYYGQTTISNCLFMNTQLVSYPYDSTKKGRGIMLTGTNVGVNGSEYGNITGCSFNSIGVATYWENGSGNWQFANNDVLFCSSNLGMDRYEKGILQVATGNSGNKGKINIYGNKFNHNFSISIFSGYITSGSYRPILIDGNEFLSNSAMPIYLQDNGHIITNNVFDRMAETPGSASGTNPWAADTAKTYILLDSSLNTKVSGNIFIGTGNNPAKYALKTTNSDYTYFQNNIFTPGALGINIPDAVSYVDTTNSGVRYINDDVAIQGEAYVTTTPEIAVGAAGVSFLVTDATTQVQSMPFDQGVYLPVDSAGSNVDGVTPDTAFYTRVGNVVTVSGTVEIDPTTTLTPTFFHLNLPVFATTTNSNRAGGTFAAYIVNESGAVIMGGITSALFQFNPTATGANIFSYTYSYRIE